MRRPAAFWHAGVVQVTHLAAAVRAAGVAELTWGSGSGAAPRALGAVPLLLGEQPVLALTWADADAARSAAGSDEVALVLSEPRLTGAGWTPLVARGRMRLVEDGDGSLFTERLLAQELRKHPPSRALADSPMVRREHWWYLPRLLLLLEPVAVEQVRARTGPQDAVLVVDDDGLVVRTVAVADWAADELALTGGPQQARGPAVLVGQEISEPDLERWTVHVTEGDYASGVLRAVRRPPTRRLEPVPGLLARVRRQRALERACVRALRAAGHG